MQVTSESGTVEFPDNKANHFKNRLPYPLQFRESGWKVGMTSISHPVPPPHAHQIINLPDDDLICRMEWTGGGMGKDDFDQDAFVYKRHSSLILVKYWRNESHLVTTGKSLMKYVQYKVMTDLNLMEKEGDSLLSSDGKKLFPVFRWEGDDFIVDNTDTYLTDDNWQKRPTLTIGRKLAEKMRWIAKNSSGEYRVDRNLIQEFPTHKVESVVKTDWDPSTGVTGGNWSKFWLLTENDLILSPFCNWRFIYLDESYKKAFGGNVTTPNPHRSPFFVYSNVGQSTVTGDQVTDLLREIPMDPMVMSYEPVNPLYLPVRTDVMDIIEVLLTEHNGDLVHFVRGVTRLTLHFKYE